MSGINYLVNRLQTYSLTVKAKNAEKNIIKNILRNEHDTNLIRKLPTQKKKTTKYTYRFAGSKSKMGYLYI
jgi:hypothetical protein